MTQPPITSFGDDMERLVHEALNLVVRARKLDEAILAVECKKLGSYHPDHMRCGTPHLWLMDQYDTDLAAWEAKAKTALQKSGRTL